MAAGSPSISAPLEGLPDGISAPTPAPVGVGYRPHLDGLRAVAVYLVVAFHAGVSHARGGFIGVDVFFVLSGYLVTQLLTRELTGSGSLSFRRFYARRAKRLLPAAAVNLIATAAVFAVIAPPVELQAATDSIRAAALYYVNWYFIAQSADYFGSDVAGSPVAHYWSLSIEEQFYLLWPVLLTGLTVATRRLGSARLAVTRGVVLVAALASLAAAVHIGSTDLNRAYYGTDTRAYQLLAGALLALTPGLLRRVAAHRVASRVAPLAAFVALAGVLVLATSATDVSPVTRGALVTALACGLIVSLEAVPGLVRSGLSLTPVTYLGRISYGTYLWHWIVILVIDRTYDLSPVGTLAVAIPVATGLASLSYQLLEHPVRVAPTLARHRNAVIAGGLALSGLVGLVVAPALLAEPDRSGDPPIAAALASGTRVPQELVDRAFFDRFDFAACPPGEGRSCVLVEGDGPKILVVGESHAGMLTPMLSRIAERHGAELSGGYLSYCPWVEGIRYNVAGKTCFEEQEAMFHETIPALDPDIVVLAHRSYDDPARYLDLVDVDAGRLVAGTDEATQAVRRRMTDLVAELRADGRKVVIVEPIPVTSDEKNPLTCLSGAEAVEECRFVTRLRPTPEEQVMRELDEQDDGVWSLDLDALACPWLPICDPVIGGEVVRSDDNHLTLTYVDTMLTDPVEAFLLDNGILEG